MIPSVRRRRKQLARWQREHGGIDLLIWRFGNDTGFLMFYAEEKTCLRRAMTEVGLREVRFRFDFEGTRVVIQ